MTGIVVAIASSTLFIDSQRIHIHQGSAWAADSVVVQENPELFSHEPQRALGLDIVPSASTPSARVEDPPVEQKTAAPGEKSNVKRRGLFGR